jgi:tetratricopeptide (TPR) repeat protein/ADP-heptose:LPS heptosyltransferase
MAVESPVIAPPDSPSSENQDPERAYREGMKLLERGQPAQAVERLREATSLKPDSAVFHHNLAVALARSNAVEEALKHFLRSIELNPRSVDSYGNLVLVYQQLGRHDEAIDCLRHKVHLLPNSAEAHHQLGNALRTAGRYEEALASYQHALRIKPDFPDVYHSLGLTLSKLSRRDDAANAYRKAIDLKPDFASAYNNLGIIYLDRGKQAEAIKNFRQAIRLQAESPEAHNNLGIALAELDKQEEAVVCYREALRLRPDYAEAHNNIGNALRDLGQVDEAIARFNDALRLKPEYAEAYNNLGIALVIENRLEDAVALYGRALELKPDYPDARKNRSLAWLAQGDFQQGWREYEFRWHNKHMPPRKFAQPRWDGSPLAGRTIMIYPEQGLGDSIQFVRFLPLLQQQGGKVVFECQRALVNLLSSCRGFDALVPEKTPLPPFDVQAPMMSLPHLLGVHSEAVPAEAPYIFPEPNRIRLWGQLLAHLSGFKVGIAWQGNPRFKADRHRSVPLRHFAPLASVPGVRLISLQKGKGTEQMASAGFRLLELGNDLDKAGAFLDTAAIMQNLDLVITSDTAIAHLAGALGVPVWVAVTFAPDWRWMRNRTDSPWYPTMRLFRQPKRADWPSVFAQMKDALSQLVAKGQEDPRRQDLGAAHPESTSRLHRLSIELAKQGMLQDAVTCLEEVRRRNPMSADAEGNLGLALLNQGRATDAIPHFLRCLALKPDRADMHVNLGVALLRLKRTDDAIANYRQALRLRPDYAEAHNNLGNALRALGKYDAAAGSLREALRLRPDFAEAHHNLGLVLEQQGQHAEAIDAFRKAIEHKPTHAGAHLQLGTRLANQNQHDAAIPHLRKATELEPGRAEAHYRLGNSLRLTGKADEAAGCYRETIRLRPNFAEAHNNLGIILANRDELAAAEASYRRGLQAKPDHVETLNNLAVLLTNQQRFEEAHTLFAEAVRLAPKYAEARRNRAFTWLLTGDLEQGWAEYEWRLKCADGPPERFKQRRWDGSPLAGRTILLHSEQGLGDIIHFVRYAPLVKDQGARVVVEAPPRLVPLLRTCPGIDELVSQGAPLPSFDTYASLMSLPFLSRTRMDNVPTAIPYLSADPQLVERWGRALDRVQGFRVGISWQGNPRYGGDRRRSIPLRHFAALARIAGVQLISLQKGSGIDQLAEPAVNFPVVSFERQADESAGAFMDTAALIRNVDLVITSDSAVAHLAGALGAPVWIVLGDQPDWRWLLKRPDTPWYPTAQLFRRSTETTWDEVFQGVATLLEEKVKAKCRGAAWTPVAVGELIDKITILEIKAARLTSPDKLRNVHYELEILRATQARAWEPSEALDNLTRELRAVNEALWDIEDEIRRCEAAGDFGPRFIELARSVYRQNDQRAALKRRLNELLGSAIVEEKSYAEWQKK